MLNWGFFVQHGATNEMPPLSLRRPWASFLALFTDTRWLLGYAIGLGGWGLYIAALGFAPISLVQAVAAGGIGLLALFVWRLTRVRLSRREQAAIALALGGLAVLCVSFAGGVPAGRTPGAAPVVAWVAGAAALGGLAWWPGERVMRPGAGLGMAAGLLYAAGDVATKGAVSGVGLYLWPVLLACLVAGFMALQLAFQRGSALATAGVSTLLNNAVPIVAGIAVFHERLPQGTFGALRVLAFVMVVAGAATLARPEAAASLSSGGAQAGC